MSGTTATTKREAARLQVRKRSGTVVDYNTQKIMQAVRLCLVNGCARNDDDATKELASRVAKRVEQILVKSNRAANPDPVNVECIQDLVETVLMAMDEHNAAKQYILYREEHRRLREAVEVDPTIERAIKADLKHFSSDAQVFQHYDKYARFNDDAKRRETFVESTDRQIAYLRFEIEQRHGRQGVVSADEWQRLRLAILESRATPSMRLQQTAGPAATRCNVGIYNCSYCGISDLDYFHEGLYISMQGTGHAFSVESELVEQLPMVKPQRVGYLPDPYIVADDTIGWCDSVKQLIYALFDGYDLNVNYDLIRPAGARLITKGGTSSGPKALIELHQAMRRIILARQGKRLRDIDVHDIMCFVGRAGEMGGFRRAACLSMSDLDSLAMRLAKASGADGKGYWSDPAKIHRSMANNSAAYWVKPPPLEFLDEWVSLAKSRSGERGIFNRGSILKQFPERRAAMYEGQRVLWGCNPCAEIFLHPDGQFCNLSIPICRPNDTVESLMEKVELATIFGTMQSMLTTFDYLRPRWKENCERERLLGVDLLGAMDCPLLRATNPDRDRLLARLRDHAVATNARWSARLGINASNAATCIKPGGNSGVRFGTGQSMSGWLTSHMIRHVEVGNHNPMCRFLKDQHVPNEISYRDPDTTIFAFPLKAPDAAMIVADLQTDASGNVTGIKPRRSAIEQLQDWLAFKRHYTEHNPSVSIYVADDEWLAVGHWVYDHWDDVGGLAFFPLDNGVYTQAPFTPVTPSQFEAFAQRFPKIEWEKLPRYDGGVDHCEGHREKACGGKDGCLI